MLNVTTALATAAPPASFTVAFTIEGALLEMEVIVAPVLSVSATVMLGAAAVPGPAVPATPPLPQPASSAAAANKNDAENPVIFLLQKRFNT
ncbi:MAG: hypothetical protein A2Z65_01885 [Gallionellales bacterium RIFCSPLOWO2_02_58_13]|nr:MAG: hypothetical protein A2Z65_01885 [Gallionellales bacterium RIFCSPLOWO2_02_58_13]